MKQTDQTPNESIDRARLRRVKIIFAAIYFFFMLARAVFGPFITVYLEEKGLSPEQIGLITGINSFALFTIGVLYYMDSIAPPDIRTTYQTVAYSIYFGLSGIVGNLFSRWIIENLGYRPMYWIGIAVTVGSTLVFAFYRRIAGKNPKVQA